MTVRRALLLVALAIVLAVACAANTRATVGRTTRPSNLSHVIGPNAVGGLPIGGTTSYRQVVRYFARAGLPTFAASFSVWGCTLRSPSGLAFQFDSLAYIAHRRATAATCTTFGRASLTSSQWHTKNGLRVGASLQTMRNLYPHAFDNGLGKPPPGVANWCAYWALDAPRNPGPALFAYTTHGRIAALGIELIGH